jgi:hypothetical protein
MFTLLFLDLCILGNTARPLAKCESRVINVHIIKSGKIDIWICTLFAKCIPCQHLSLGQRTAKIDASEEFGARSGTKRDCYFGPQEGVLYFGMWRGKRKKCLWTTGRQSRGVQVVPFNINL